MNMKKTILFLGIACLFVSFDNQIQAKVMPKWAVFTIAAGVGTTAGLIYGLTDELKTMRSEFQMLKAELGVVAAAKFATRKLGGAVKKRFFGGRPGMNHRPGGGQGGRPGGLKMGGGRPQGGPQGDRPPRPEGHPHGGPPGIRLQPSPALETVLEKAAGTAESDHDAVTDEVDTTGED